MSESNQPKAGTINWVDLTVEDAPRIRDFYQQVVGWKPQPVDMGGYSDFSMETPEAGHSVAGICHARGPNANLPPQWLIYIQVADLNASIARCRELGGEVLLGPKSLGAHGHLCVIRDPAGAVAALVGPASP